jgi:putative transcriptional regulator
MTDERDAVGVLRNKRDATRYQILVEIAQRQPAVSQQEIADEIGVTAQAVSEHLGDLVEQGYVEREARGRYEVTKEGVDWLISETDALREYVTHVSEDVIGDVEVDTAIAAAEITEGERVALSMEDGVLTATPVGEESDDNSEEPESDDASVPAEDGASEKEDDTSEKEDDTSEKEDDTSEKEDGASEKEDGATGKEDGATARAVMDADAGRDVGVTDFEGVVAYDLGTVTAVEVPSIRAGGSRTVESEQLRSLAAEADLVAVAGTEALAAVRAAEVTPDVRFGTEDAVEEAAAKGLDVLLVAAGPLLSAHADRLRDSAVGFEVVDARGT